MTSKPRSPIVSWIPIWHAVMLFISPDAAKIMRFEKAQVWLNFIERNFVYPVVFLSALTRYAKPLVDKFGIM